MEAERKSRVLFRCAASSRYSHPFAALSTNHFLCGKRCVSVPSCLQPASRRSAAHELINNVQNTWLLIPRVLEYPVIGGSNAPLQAGQGIQCIERCRTHFPLGRSVKLGVVSWLANVATLIPVEGSMSKTILTRFFLLFIAGYPVHCTKGLA